MCTTTFTWKQKLSQILNNNYTFFCCYRWMQYVVAMQGSFMMMQRLYLMMGLWRTSSTYRTWAEEHWVSTPTTWHSGQTMEPSAYVYWWIQSSQRSWQRQRRAYFLHAFVWGMTASPEHLKHGNCSAATWTLPLKKGLLLSTTAWKVITR